jgi:hypothetical protein
MDKQYEFVRLDELRLSLSTDPFYVIQRILHFCAPLIVVNLLMFY